jgi:DNA-binding MurR/RpiR family transcriptional regulator
MMQQDQERAVPAPAEAGHVLTRIRALQDSLTPSELAVARLISADTAAVLGLSVEVLAARAGVSTASVMRLCRSLGFSGFRELKLALALERRLLPAADTEQEIMPDDSPLQVARKVLAAEACALHETLDLIDEAALNQAVATLAGANRIELYGMGSSAPVVLDAYYRLMRLGLPVSSPPDSHMQSVSAALLKPGDAVLVVSHVGRTTGVLNAARRARAVGATVVALTSFLRSPLLDIAHIHLVTAVREASTRVEAMAARTAHLGLIDTLCVSLALRLQERAQDTLELTQQAIDEQRS